MSTSFVHDIGAQYLASVLSALTLLAAGALRAAWRRRNHPRRQQAPAPADVLTHPATPDSVPEQPAAPDGGIHAAGPAHVSGTSSEGRRQVSS
jgi:hypothetical protein